MRSVTYAASILIDIVHDISKNGVHMGVASAAKFRSAVFRSWSVPCTATHNSERKQECRLDQGGFFIINGIEKRSGARKLHTNQTYIFNVKQPSKFQLVAEIRSCHELKMRSTSTLYITSPPPNKEPYPKWWPAYHLSTCRPSPWYIQTARHQDPRRSTETIVGNLDAEETRLALRHTGQ